MQHALLTRYTDERRSFLAYNAVRRENTGRIVLERRCRQALETMDMDALADALAGWAHHERMGR